MHWTYPIIMGAALTIGVVVSRLTQSDLRLSRVERFAVLFGAFVGAMVLAKVPYVWGDWNSLASGVVWFRDGKTILCGLAGGYLGVVVAKWSMGITARTGDSFAVPVAATIAVGRLACFFGQCCYGTATDLPWGVVFERIDLVARHPTQVYEFIFHLTAALTLWSLRASNIFPGNLFKAYVIAYAVYRFFTEWIRPEPTVWLGLTGYQWGSLALATVFACLWLADVKRDDDSAASGQWGFRPGSFRPR